MKTALLSAVGFLLILAAELFSSALNPPPQEPRSQSGLQYEVAVTLKLVQVFVVDKKGNPVLDLRKEDFVVQDNGRVQVISEFERHSLSLPAPRPEASPASLEPTPLEPPRELMSRKFILLFDFAYNNPKGILKAKEAALHFIVTQLRPMDEVGVMSYSGLGGLQLWEYLTADHQKVREVVEAFGLKKLAGRVDNLQEKYYAAVTGQNPADASDWGRATLKGKEKQLPDMGAKPDLEQVPGLKPWVFSEKGELQALTFADRLKELALALRYEPGQKSIVFLSSGVPYSLIYGIQAPFGDVRFGTFGESLIRQRYDDMLQEMAASNCIFYALDTEEIGASLKKDVRTMGVFTLQKIAGATGGKYYGNINHYEKHLEKIQNLTGCFYVLGYSIDEKWDGAFHSIKVEVNRPECEVHAQRGYFSPKPFREYSELEKMLHLVDLAMNDDPAFQAPVRFPVVRMPCPAGQKANLCLTCRLPFQEIRDLVQGKVEIVSIVFDEKGNTVELKRDVKTAADLEGDNAVRPLHFELPPGNYECRIIIRNLETGRGAVGGTSVVMAKE